MYIENDALPRLFKESNHIETKTKTPIKILAGGMHDQDYVSTLFMKSKLSEVS
jgi:hypothetical protein